MDHMAYYNGYYFLLNDFLTQKDLYENTTYHSRYYSERADTLSYLLKYELYEQHIQFNNKYDQNKHG